jgi:hypothetical protein
MRFPLCSHVDKARQAGIVFRLLRASFGPVSIQWADDRSLCDISWNEPIESRGSEFYGVLSSLDMNGTDARHCLVRARRGHVDVIHHRGFGAGSS